MPCVELGVGSVGEFERREVTEKEIRRVGKEDGGELRRAYLHYFAFLLGMNNEESEYSFEIKRPGVRERPVK